MTYHGLLLSPTSIYLVENVFGVGDSEYDIRKTFIGVGLELELNYRNRSEVGVRNKRLRSSSVFTTTLFITF